MATRLDAIDRAKELALKGMSPGEIHRQLVKEGLGNFLHVTEIQRMMVEIDLVRHLHPRTNTSFLPRMVGVAALVLGLGAISLGFTMPEAKRSSPTGLGAIAVVLGIILIAKPSASKTEL